MEHIPANGVCTMSSNTDWDELFNNYEIIEMSLDSHARGKNYLPLSANTHVLNGQKQGSLIAFGDRIGGTGYGNRVVKPRVFQMSSALGKLI